VELTLQYRIIRLETTASTMKDAAAHPPGTVVVSEEQTAGLGRLGRKWHSERGGGLYFSAALPLPGSEAAVPVLMLAFGLAVRNAVEETTGITADLRWPNDVLIGDKKCAGILVELQAQKLVVGIGININQTAFPEEIVETATSLRVATGREYTKDEVLDRVLRGLTSYMSLLEREGPEAVLRLFTQASSYVSGRRITVNGVEGTTEGLNSSGFLWLRSDDGRRQLIVAGGIRPVIHK
jgi:BirA family biotin operon repressor/biotin-[acetyl-CoA-carboxylase] ligase